MAEEDADGRTARRGRNRTAVLDALLELFAEGQMRPGAAQLAQRSGVSARSVFRYFDDVDELIGAAIERHDEKSQPLYAIADEGTGPLEGRINRLIEQRLRLHTAVAPILRASALRAPFQPSIALAMARRRAALRRQVEKQFALELSTLDEPTATATAAALDVLCSLEALDALRQGRRFSAERTAIVLRTAISALLRPPPAKRPR